MWKVLRKPCGGRGGLQGGTRLLWPPPHSSLLSTTWELCGVAAAGRRGHGTTLPHPSGLVGSMLAQRRAAPLELWCHGTYSSCGAAVSALSPWTWCGFAFEALEGWSSGISPLEQEGRNWPSLSYSRTWGHSCHSRSQTLNVQERNK